MAIFRRPFDYAQLRRSWLPSRALSAYVLTAAAGSLALTGQDVGLRKGSLVAAAVATYTESGQAVNLRAARALTTGQGSFAESGQAAGLRVARLLGAGQGALALSGQTAALNYSGSVGPEAAGEVTLTLAQSQNVTLTETQVEEIAITMGGAMPAPDGSYYVGERVRLTASCKKDKVLTDPTTFKFRYLPPSGTAVEAQYGVDGGVIKETTGKFYKDVDLTTAGRWQVRAEGTGTLVGADQAVIRVKAANV